MKNKSLASALLLCIFFLYSFKLDEKVKDWFLAGSNPSEYEIGIVEDSDRKENVAYLKSTKSKVKKGFGTIMQSFKSDIYNGKKVKLSGFIKTIDVDNWVGMWMRVDGDTKRAVSFDNMQDRPIEGTTAWKQYDIILDVPKESAYISYGVLLSGPGEVYLDDLTFTVVEEDEKSTGRIQLTAPSNSDFDK